MLLGSNASPSQGYPQHLICQFPFTHLEGGKSVLNTHLLKKQTLFTIKKKIIKVMENQRQGPFIAFFSKRLCRRTKHKPSSIYKKFSKISIRNFRLGRDRSICHKSHSFPGPSPSLHRNTRCLGKMFCNFFERVFVRRFPVKQIFIIGTCCYEKSDICMFPSF